jgi:dTDP-glucose 4,6-dehydratase
MRLLVTGGAGFIGSNLIRHLLAQDGIEQLHCLDLLTYAGHLENLADAQRDPRFAFHQIDIRHRPALQQLIQTHHITHVMHLAAESHVDRSIAGPDDFITTNILGTFNLIEACRAAWSGAYDGKRFLHVSTDEVYGSLGPEGYFTETTPYSPNSPYSASKASSDHLVRAAHHTYNFPAVITNCSNNYGPYQFPEKLIPVTIQKTLARQPIPIYGDGQNIRDWLYVADHCEALWQALTRAPLGETYNIGGHNECKNIDIAKQICALIDELRPDLGGGTEKLITFVKDRPGHDRRYAIDAAKIQRDLGWTPQHTFQTGLRETVQWYLANQEWVRSVTTKKSN